MTFFVVSLCSLSIQQVGYTNELNTFGRHNVIGLSYKKDFVLSAGNIPIKSYQQIDMQLAIAYHDFLAVQMGFNNTLGFETLGDKFSNNFINISAGIFHNTLLENSKLYHKKGKWDNRFKRRHFLVDAYLAYGKGINKTSLETTIFTPDRVIRFYKPNHKILFNKLYLQGGAHYHGNVFGFSLIGLLGVLQFNKVVVYARLNSDIENLIQVLEKENHHLTSGYTMKVSLSFKRFKLVYGLQRDYVLGFDNLNHYIASTGMQLNLQVNLYNLL